MHPFLDEGPSFIGEYRNYEIRVREHRCYDSFVIDPGEFSTRLPVYNARKSIEWAAVGSPWIIETRGTRSGSGRDEEAPVTSGEMGFSESELHDGRCLTNKPSSLLEG